MGLLTSGEGLYHSKVLLRYDEACDILYILHQGKTACESESEEVNPNGKLVEMLSCITN